MAPVFNEQLRIVDHMEDIGGRRNPTAQMKLVLDVVEQHGACICGHAAHLGKDAKVCGIVGCCEPDCHGHAKSSTCPHQQCTDRDGTQHMEVRERSAVRPIGGQGAREYGEHKREESGHTYPLLPEPYPLYPGLQTPAQRGGRSGLRRIVGLAEIAAFTMAASSLVLHR